MTASEKFCLKWNDFKENVSTSFATLRDDTDLSDVTLVCEDGQQLVAHKVILAHAGTLAMIRIKGDPLVNHTVNSRLEREAGWTKNFQLLKLCTNVGRQH